MDWDFISVTLFNLATNLIYTAIALAIGLVAIKIVDKQVLKTLDIEKELKNNNMAVSVFASTILIFIAIIVSFGLRG